MSFDGVTNYTLNRYPLQCSQTCTCTQYNQPGASTPALFNYGISGGFNFTPGGVYGINLLNPLIQLFNNFNFQMPCFNLFSYMNSMPASNFSNFSSMFTPTYTLPSFGNLTISSSTDETTSSSSTKTYSGSITTISAYSNKKETLLKNIAQNDTKFEEQLKEKGVVYNKDLGHNLASYIIAHTTNTTGRCAHYVNNALEEYNIDPKRGDAYTRADVLAADKNFTEVQVNSKEDLKSLPGGAVVVYDRGACNYSDDFGHVFIATGNGGAASDHLQNQIKFGDGIRVFIPTKPLETTV